MAPPPVVRRGRDQHGPGQLLQVQRHTVGPIQDALDELPRQGVAAGLLRHKRRRGAVVEAPEREGGHVALLGPGRVEPGPERDDHHHRSPTHPFDYAVQQLQRGRVGPVRVVVQDQHRAAGGQAVELVEQRPEGPLLACLRGQLVLARVTAGVGDAEQFREQRGVVVGRSLARQRQHGFQRVELALGRVVAAQARGALQQAQRRVERGVGVVGRAVEGKWRVSLVDQPCAQGLHQPGFADAGLAADEDHLPLAFPGQPPPVEQQAELATAPEQRRQARRSAQRLEPAPRRVLARDPPHLHRRREPLWQPGAQALEGEQLPKLPAHRLGQHHGPRRTHRVQARREVRRLADDLGCIGRPGDDYEAGGDADAARQGPDALQPQSGHGLGRREAGAHGPLGIVLVGVGPAEAGEDAVALVVEDPSIESVSA
jgi:hypothetical protein